MGKRKQQRHLHGIAGGPVKKAVVLLSGGLDSATALYWAKREGYNCSCLVFDYGQRHKREIESAKKISESAGCRFSVVRMEMPWKGSALLAKGRIEHRSIGEIGREIPSTYVPSRNTIFLSFAVSCAEATGADAVFIGANAVDFSGYPDCRPGYFRIFNRLVSAGTKKGIERRSKGIRVIAPLVDMTKSGIIKLGRRLGVPYGLTWSCYEGKKKPCMKCDSCLLREAGFRAAGIPDPLLKADNRNSKVEIWKRLPQKHE